MVSCCGRIIHRGFLHTLTICPKCYLQDNRNGGSTGTVLHISNRHTDRLWPLSPCHRIIHCHRHDPYRKTVATQFCLKPKSSGDIRCIALSCGGIHSISSSSC